MNTPVAFMIFNRASVTARVFESIRQAQPPILLVVADGPRSDKLGEEQKCAATRKIIEQVDWPCEVKTNYSNVNLGCGKRISSGLDWVFSEVQEAIILEDDCLPHPDFFRFCEELLEKYRYDSRVMCISGDNFQVNRGHEGSYYFSNYAHIWGWATWRRAWKYYDYEMTSWPEIRDKKLLHSTLPDANQVSSWERILNKVYDRKIDTWDYQWMFSCWSQSGFTILPQVNLISNIGFGAEANHTKGNSPYAEMPTCSLDFPLIHPNIMLRDFKADAATARNMYPSNYFEKAMSKLKNLRNW